MQFTSPPELTTAITDFILGCQSLIFLFMIRSYSRKEPLKIRIWSWVFGLLATVSIYGAVVHGIVMDRETQIALWMPLTFLLGMMVSIFAIGVMYDWKGSGVLKKATVTMLSLGVIFFIAMLILSKLVPNSFIIFIAYSGGTMLFSLVIYACLAAKRRDGSLVLMAAGIATIIVASVLQAMRSIHFTLIWEFDFNSVYHVIIMVAVILFYGGLRKSVG